MMSNSIRTNINSDNKNVSKRKKTKSKKSKKSEAEKEFYERLINLITERQKTTFKKQFFRFLVNFVFLFSITGAVVFYVFKNKKTTTQSFSIEDPKEFTEQIFFNFNVMKEITSKIKNLVSNSENKNKFQNKEKFFLLQGRPGTGKSYFCKALAKNLTEQQINGKNMKVGFIEISAADIFSKYFGESENKIKDLFSLINKSKKEYDLVFVFFDEINYLLRKNSGFSAGASMGPLKSTLLSYMDGSRKVKNDKFVFFGTMNDEIGQIDKAFKRRFGNKYVFENLTSHNIQEVIDNYSNENELNLFDSEDIKEIIKLFENKPIDSLICALKRARNLLSETKSLQKTKKEFFSKIVYESLDDTVVTNNLERQKLTFNNYSDIF